MRELKFRAWDKDKKRMIDWKYLIDYCDIDYLFGNQCLEEKRDTVPDFKIMQYTGLKDKSGKEIYEGDIVIFNHIKNEYPESDNIFLHNVNRMEYQKKYVAEFCNTYYRYGVRFRNGSTHFMVVQATIMNHNVEVIGNIYENLELLELI